MKLIRSLWAGALVSCLATAGCNSEVRPPKPLGNRSPTKSPSRVTAATNLYHGVAVIDPCHWLEDGTDPAVQEWTTQQNRQTRAFLDAIPERALILDRLTRLLTESAADYSSLNWQRGALFFLKSPPSTSQPLLARLQSLTNLASERVLLNPNNLPDGPRTIDWYEPSPDSQWVAVSLSIPGTKEGTLHVYSASTGEPRPDVIPGVQAPTAGGSVAWNPDSTGFFYTRYPRPGERPAAELHLHQQVYYHRLGTPQTSDIYEFGKELPPIAKIRLQSSPVRPHILASVANGDGGEYAHYLREPSGPWRRIADFKDQVRRVEFGRDPLYIEWGSDPGLYLLSFRGAPRGQILRISLDAADLSAATTILPEGEHVIMDFKPAASGLCLVHMKGGPTAFGYLDYFDNIVRTIEERTPTAIREMVVTEGDDILFRVETFTEPYEWLRYNPSRHKDRLESTPLVGRSPVSFSDVEVLREMVGSKDGTLIPLNIIRKRGTQLQGGNPVILSGYGCFGVSQTPQFDVTRRLWLDQGGIFAIANLRGGGEYGVGWHQAGALASKQNVFDDLAACAAFLVRSNYTRAAKLALHGADSGGLVAAAALTQHPQQIRAMVAHSGLYDMVRAELEPKGAFHATEFGTVASSEQFKVLFGYSPYHRVVDQTAYPAVLMMAAENEERSRALQSRKMAARLQSATSSPHPVLLRISGSGDGAAAQADGVEQLADVYTFLLNQLDVEFSQVDRGPWSGAVTPTSAVVKAKLIRDELTARLHVSQSASFTDSIVFGPSRSEKNHGNIVEFELKNLVPNTQFHYALEIESRLERRTAGTFRTFPVLGPASFTLAFSGDARTGSTSEVFDRIREHQPLFYMNLGDLHYLDIQTNSPPRFREAYDAVLASPQQAELYRQVPFVYLWDDHDFAGNNSNRRSPAGNAARLIYNEYVPHYPLPLAFSGREVGPICQAFTVGRVRFIITDLRSEKDDVRKKDDSTKTILGPRQKTWFKRELLEANGQYPLICWVSSVAWIGQPGINAYGGVKTNQYGYIHHSQLPNDAHSRTNRGVGPAVQDWWSSYSVERREIADFIKLNRINGLCILHADAHMLAADDGTHSDYATGGGAPLPVMCAAPLDKEPSIKGGPYSQGIYRVKPPEGAFGLLTIADQGTRIDVTYSGRTHLDEEKISLKFSVPASPTPSSPLTRRIPE